jgi:cytochrome c oxidase subunit II
VSVFGGPVEASSIAGQVDALFYSLLGLSAAVVLGIVGTIGFFSVRYRRGSSASRRRDVVQWRWELGWTLIPLGLFLAVYVWAAWLYFVLHSPPDDAMPIYVVGKQWMWQIQHASGQREIDQLHVPVGRPVKLIMTSQDVIHSFFVPAFRVKQDVLPGRYTTLWFTATRPGEYALFCAEYCGTDHARMGGRVIALSADRYQQWLQAHPVSQGLARQGEKLFHQYGCSGCHTPGSAVHAPNLHGVFGHFVQLADGSRVMADERYVRDSILLPRRQVVAGYVPVMPSFAGQVSEEDLLALIAYVESIGTREEQP